MPAPDVSPELEQLLTEARDLTLKGETVLLLFEDMTDINEHFQAALDWFKENGNKMRRRFGQGAFMETGMVYFVGADTHLVRTRGVSKEFDCRPFAHELIRKTGLEARLRAAQQQSMCANFPDQPCLNKCHEGCARAKMSDVPVTA
jgi:hypothetical protein